MLERSGEFRGDSRLADQVREDQVREDRVAAR